MEPFVQSKKPAGKSKMAPLEPTVSWPAPRTNCPPPEPVYVPVKVPVLPYCRVAPLATVNVPPVLMPF